jgi:hypothetical protein
LIATGVAAFLDGIFRLGCQPIDAGCSNDSWHSHAHKIESGFTMAATFIALLLVALALRRIPRSRDSWLPTIATIPGVIVASVAFSPIGGKPCGQRRPVPDHQVHRFRLIHAGGGGYRGQPTGSPAP